MSAGRPSKYKAEYCEMAIDFLSQGYTVRSFAAEIGVVSSTVYLWAEQIEEFSDALRKGVDKSFKWHEQKLKEAIDGKASRNMNYRALEFALKSRFKEIYSEKQIIEQSSTISINIDDTDADL